MNYICILPVPELLPVISAARRFSMAVGPEGQIVIQISLFVDTFFDHMW